MRWHDGNGRTDAVVNGHRQESWTNVRRAPVLKVLHIIIRARGEAGDRLAQRAAILHESHLFAIGDRAVVGKWAEAHSGVDPVPAEGVPAGDGAIVTDVAGKYGERVGLKTRVDQGHTDDQGGDQAGNRAGGVGDDHVVAAGVTARHGGDRETRAGGAADPRSVLSPQVGGGWIAEGG